MAFMTFHILGMSSVIIPTDEQPYFSGVGIPPTSHNTESNKVLMKVLRIQ